MDSPALKALTAHQAVSTAPQEGRERAAVEKRPEHPPREPQAPVQSESTAPKKSGNYLSIQMDDESGKTVVKVMDSTTNEVLRQFPAQELVNLARHLGKMQGMLLDREA